jgi:hypothetical protein
MRVLGCPSGATAARGARLLSTGGRGTAALGPSLTAGAPPPHVLGAWASLRHWPVSATSRGPPTVRLRASGGLRPACVPRWRSLARRRISSAPRLLSGEFRRAKNRRTPSRTTNHALTIGRAFESRECRMYAHRPRGFTERSVARRIMRSEKRGADGVRPAGEGAPGVGRRRGGGRRSRAGAPSVGRASLS